MTCKECTSRHLQDFSGELVVAFPGIERLKLDPVYVGGTILVCLDCGYTELVIPAAKLEQLRKGIEAFGSIGAHQNRSTNISNK